ncbi:kinase-like protein [Gyrodon lividus]|nr:kinase-like protein [Gyrodon lividus]
MVLMWYLPAFLFFFAALCLAESLSLGRSAINDALSTATAVDRRSLTGARIPRSAATEHTSGEDSKDINLFDIVLVASVDGRFHAVSRTSGQKLWSMSAATRDLTSSLAPLVRTKHPTLDPDLTDDDDAHQELYIIEPQTGDIYVMATPTSPLQPLSFSMSQLVEMSPFMFAREDDERVFVGKKETSLLSIELETGKVKVINAECPWDPFEDFSSKGELDLDELEDHFAKKDKFISTEVFIGRTDYHVSIYTRSNSPSGRKSPVQNLSFSSYGPNTQDNAMQAAYRRTADNTYIESLPSGQIISFKARDSDPVDPYTRRESQILWALSFDSPIVAVFDVLSSSGRQDPFVLMQPRPAISDVLQGFDRSSVESIYDPDMAYVGLVEETESFFVMGNDRFPLITFGDTEYSPNSRLIDPPPSVTDPHRDFPDKVDSITKRRKLKKLCDESPFDKRCLMGKHPLDASSLNTRQLPGVPSVELPPEFDSGRNKAINSENSMPRLADSHDNMSSIVPSWMWPSAGGVTRGAKTIGEGLKVSALGSVLLAMIFGSTWLFRDRFLLGTLHPWIPQLTAEMKSVSTPIPSFTTPDSSASSIPSLATVPNGNGHENISDLPEVPPSPSLQPSIFVDADVTSTSSASTFDSPRRTVELVDPPAAVIETLDSPTVDVPDAEESEREGDPAGGSTPKKRRPARRRRGKKGKGNGAAANGAVDDTEGEKDAEGASADGGEERNQQKPPASTTLIVQSTSKVAGPSLIVSDTILGFGSHGTVVFQGSFQGRAVAIKRLLQDFVTLASREVSVLQESDDHPNVIRYYYQESHGNFLYIALELCPASLADVIESPDQHRDIAVSFDPKRALRQITSGLRHLHSLKIVHRDIKPQNILVSAPNKGVSERDGGRRMLISDFGLCKKLEVDQTSFVPTAQGAQAAGTVGWRAPEILRGEVKLDDTLSDDTSQSSRGSTSTVVNGGSSTPNASSGKSTRLTKAVDIFASGCLFYYVLTNGSHPFGSKFERESNIIKNVKSLGGLERFGEEGSEAVDLIGKMLDPEACNRPDTASCLLHPFFWNPSRRLNFLQDASDRFEIMCRDPRDQNLNVLEAGAFNIVGHDWHVRLDKVFIENLGKFRKYDGKCVQDLLRALRNKKHHYQDLPDHVKRNLGPMPEGFLAYFTKRFPSLFMHVHGVISETHLRRESMFRSYFELSES